jgi:hypothetical protein
VIWANGKAARKTLIDELSVLPIPPDLIAVGIGVYATPS